LPGEILDLSADGSVIVGTELSPDRTFRWKLGEGVKFLSVPGSTENSLGYGTSNVASGSAVTADGSIVVGIAEFPATPETERVFRWDAEADTVTILPQGTATEVNRFFPTVTNTTIFPTADASVSEDGNVIVGTGLARGFVGGSPVTASTDWVFRWVNGSGTSDDLQAAFAQIFKPRAVSPDGFAVAGRVFPIPTEFTAARWLSGSGLVLPSSADHALAISHDGEFLAGSLGSVLALSTAYRWTSVTGLETIGLNLRERSMSDDGGTIASLFFPTPPLLKEPHIWDSANGDRWMVQALADDFGLFGFSTGVQEPDGLVSGDGTVFSLVGADWVAKVTPINFVSLGDSFSSGEGVPMFDPLTDNANNQCHRSFAAYATLARPRSSTKTLNELGSAGAEQQPGFTWHFLACSGATTRNVTADPVEGSGQHPGTIDASPQLAQDFVDGDTDLVTITIGGNDLGFTKLAKDCATKPSCQNREAHDLGIDWDVYLPQQITGPFRTTVTALYQEIRAAAPKASIVALGYPLLVSGRVCDDLKVKVKGIVTLLGMSAAEQAFIRTMSDLLNEVLIDAAEVAGIQFVGVASEGSLFSFFDHEVCTDNDDPWIHGIMDEEVFSLHPNGDGQAVYAGALNAFIAQTGVGYEPGFFASGLPKNPAPQP
jgi:hypothetical protein